MWERLARRLGRLEPKPFFRLATLADPFQPCEEIWMASLRMLRACLRYNIPVIVNTKSVLASRSPWLDVLQALADRGLVLVQVSLAFLESWSLLEPRAPPPEERLELIEKLGEHGVPVVVRVQPLVPGLEEEQSRVLQLALEAGALGAIGESLRETREGLMELSRRLGYSLLEACRWEPYQPLGAGELLHPVAEWRLHIHTRMWSIARAYGRVYTACKEGIYWLWSRGRDCCQAWLGIRHPYMLRPTLYELLYTGSTSVVEAVERLGEPYKASTMLRGYPKVVRRGMKLHEKRLERLARSSKHVAKLVMLKDAPYSLARAVEDS